MNETELVEMDATKFMSIFRMRVEKECALLGSVESVDTRSGFSIRVRPFVFPWELRDEFFEVTFRDRMVSTGFDDDDLEASAVCRTHLFTIEHGQLHEVVRMRATSQLNYSTLSVAIETTIDGLKYWMNAVGEFQISRTHYELYLLKKIIDRWDEKCFMTLWKLGSDRKLLKTLAIGMGKTAFVTLIRSLEAAEELS